MTRRWRQELAEARRAQRRWCDVCVGSGNAVPVTVYAYALRPSAASPCGTAAVRDTEHRLEIGVCPRPRRALTPGRVLLAGDQAIALTTQHARREGRAQRRVLAVSACVACCGSLARARA